MSTDAAPRTVQRFVGWTGVEGQSLEHAVLTLDDGLTLEGVVSGDSDGVYVIRYRIRADAAGHTRELHLDYVGGPRLHLRADERMRWRDDNRGESLPELDGCHDVDLGFSPATNTLPIRRLSLPVGETAEIRAVYVPLPPTDAGFHPVPVTQRYTRLADDLWRYHQPDIDFTADLPVDDMGLVLDYPRLFRRLAGA